VRLQSCEKQWAGALLSVKCCCWRRRRRGGGGEAATGCAVGYEIVLSYIACPCYPYIQSLL